MRRFLHSPIVDFFAAIGAFTFAKKVMTAQLDRLDIYCLSLLLCIMGLSCVLSFVIGMFRWMRKDA